MKRLLVVGAGHAAGSLAKSMRARGFDGRIVLVGREKHLPYERPPLSKELLLDGPSNDIWSLADGSFWISQEIDMRLGRTVAQLELGRSHVLLDDGSREPWDYLVLATGAEPRRLNVPGVHRQGVYYLRTLQDALAIHEGIQRGSACCVVGGGLIGLEVAASAARRGCKVHVLEAADRLLARVAPPPVSDYVRRLHELHGVQIHLQETVAMIDGDVRASSVVTRSGQRIAAETIVIGIGVTPALSLASAAGIACDDGIIVDEHCRTNVPNVYAIGDACRFWNPRVGRRQRLETWSHAQHQPEAIASFLTGAPQAYAPVPWSWTDQFGRNIQILGDATDAARLITRGSPDEAQFACFGLDGRRLVAAWLVNRPRDRRALQQLIETAALVDPEKLADSQVPLTVVSDMAGVLPAIEHSARRANNGAGK